MIRHLLRLLWNRKRQNLLVVIELFLSFVVLFAILFTAAIHYYNWRQPLGFTTDRLLSVQLGYPHAGPARVDATEEQTADRTRAAETLKQVLAAVEAMPEVEDAGTSWPSRLYSRGGWGMAIGDNGFRTPSASAHALSDEMRDVLGITLAAGRWFSREDDGAAVQPAIINARLARELFGDTSPLERMLPPSEARPQPTRVIGVVEDFRHEGELGFPDNAVVFRLSSLAAGLPMLPNMMMVRVHPGTTAQFEETLDRALHAVAPEWTFDVRSVETLRQEAFRKALAPIAVVGVVAIFLLLMVALGLTGVVWQSVTTRIQEFGLRRAKGATAGHIQRQVFLELILLASLAVAVGAVIVVQIPGLALLGPTSVRLSSVAVAVGVIYLLTLLCAWYPSRLATRIQPADALHYE